MFRNQTGKKKHVGQTSRAYPHGLCWDTPACSSWASSCEYAAPRCATWLAPTRPHDKLCARSGKKNTAPHEFRHRKIQSFIIQSCDTTVFCFFVNMFLFLVWLLFLLHHSLNFSLEIPPRNAPPNPQATRPASRPAPCAPKRELVLSYPAVGHQGLRVDQRTRQKNGWSPSIMG